MDELEAAAAVMAMSVDDFAEEDLEQYSPHDMLPPSMNHIDQQWRRLRRRICAG